MSTLSQLNRGITRSLASCFAGIWCPPTNQLGDAQSEAERRCGRASSFYSCPPASVPRFPFPLLGQRHGGSAKIYRFSLFAFRCLLPGPIAIAGSPPILVSGLRAPRSSPELYSERGHVLHVSGSVYSILSELICQLLLRVWAITNRPTVSVQRSAVRGLHNSNITTRTNSNIRLTAYKETT